MFRPHTAEGFAVFLAASLLTLLPAAGPGAGAQPSALALSADGKLLFVVANGAPGSACLYVWDVAKAELRAVLPDVPASTRLQPSADGARVVLFTQPPRGDPEVAVYDVAARKRLHLFSAATDYRSGSVVSPNGEWVAFRARGEKPELQVWNTATGKRAVEVEAAAGPLTGSLAFTAESKFVIASPTALTTFDPVTGKKVGGWTREAPAPRAFMESEFGTAVALLPDGKGFVSVAATGKRRQSYVVRVVTEKQDWFLGEVWDYATAPVLSPDGRLLLLIASSREAPGTFALGLGADGAPELNDQKGEEKGPFWGGGEKGRPAWRAWPPADPAGDAARTRTLGPGAGIFAPDGKRLFAIGSGRVQVFDAERRALTATLFAGSPTKDDLPAWHILTAAGEFTSSAGESDELLKDRKVRDAAKVRAALGAK